MVEGMRDIIYIPCCVVSPTHTLCFILGHCIEVQRGRGFIFLVPWI